MRGRAWLANDSAKRRMRNLVQSSATTVGIVTKRRESGGRSRHDTLLLTGRFREGSTIVVRVIL
jgi:hypothetical protein